MREITAYLIIKNEEDNLEKTLKSLDGFADEIVVVDTGSTDNSVEIAKKYADIVDYFEWCDDFAKARNYAISKATKDWIFQIDADEVMSDDIKSELKELVQNDDLVLINTTIQEYTSQNSFYLSVAQNPRLFRNRDDISYYRSYHEKVEDSIKEIIKKEPNKKVLYFTKIVTIHKGYTATNINSKDKVNRAISIMSKWIESNPNDSYILVKLASEYRDIGELEKAYDLCKRAKANKYKNRDMYLIEIDYLVAKDRLKDALKIAQTCEKEYKDEFVYNALGIVYYKLKSYDKAKKHYLKSTQINPNYANAYSNLGVLYYVTKNADKAKSSFERSISLDDRDISTLNNYAYTLLYLKDVQRAVEVFKHSLAIYPHQDNIVALLKEMRAI
jgi:Flp pilus assembly protein TadD